ncbi:MAG: OadG family protein [Desulfosalsimonadaceae bacterium]
MKKQLSFLHIKTCFILCLLAMALLLPSASMAFMDEDIEKPKPELTPGKDGIVTAKFIPRAKSTSVTIDFAVTGGGNLSAVNAFDINKALSPQINKKDFRSDLFNIQIEGVAPGDEAVLTVASSFFSTSTSYWIFNEKRQPTWMNSQAENLPLAEKVRQFVIRVKDGGQFDSDSAANGRITMIGGPSDSFWGYVLGTLFIRFFGVFIVLGVLMIGMLLSGKIFQKLEKKPEATQPDMPMDTAPSAPTPAPVPVYDWPPATPTDAVTPEMAAAIGAAMAMHQAPRIMPAPAPAHETVHETIQAAPSWAMDGRRQIMSDRSMVFNRAK